MANSWTDHDVALLRAAYDEWPGAGTVPLPEALLARHPEGSSRMKASRLGITRRCRLRQPDVPFTLAPTDAAYLAGLIDGEGHVARGQALLQITTTTPEITDWLVATVPIGRAKTRPGVTSTGKPIHRWVLSTTTGCARLYAQVLPYMKINEKRARMAEFTGLVYS